MKKIIYLLFSLCITLVVSRGQELSSTRQGYRVGDVLLKQQMSYPSTVYGDTCRFWDLSGLKPVNDDYRVIIGMSGDTLITVQEHHAVYTYEVGGDTIYLSGYQTATTRMDYDRKEVMLPFPFGEGSLYEGCFCGEGDYCGKMQLYTAGDIRIRGCSVGTLVMPSEDTLRNVLRVETVKKFADRVIPTVSSEARSIPNMDILLLQSRMDTVGMRVKTVRWYAAGSRYPVFETIESIGWKEGETYEHFCTAFMYHPENQYYDLIEDPENERVRMQKDMCDGEEAGMTVPEKGWKYRFGKSGGSLFVDFELQQSSMVWLSVSDVSGKLRISKPEFCMSKGISRVKVDLSSLSPGVYLLLIQVDGETVCEKFVK